MPDIIEPKYGLEENISHVNSWDWENQHVSNAYLDNTNGISQNNSISINDIIESGTVLIAAGPADLNSASQREEGFRIVPIGLVETAQISLNKPLSRIFEIGSALSYIIPGKTVGGISLSRVFFDGPSLLKALYFGEVKEDYASTINKFAKFVSAPYYEGSGDSAQEAYQKFANIGSGNLAMNLASSFFNQPVGLAFFFKDQQSETVGQTYFEGCRVSTYNIGISANMNVLTEGVNLEFVRCRPINSVESYRYDKKNNVADINIVSPRNQGESGGA